MKALVLVCSLLLVGRASAQGWFQRTLPHSVLSVQHAGSIGTLAMGYHRLNPSERLGIGLLYGYVPCSRGGALHTIALKGGYAPFSLRLADGLHWRPARLGLFATVTIGNDAPLEWPSHYEPGYYNWSPDLRPHLFLASELIFQHAPSWPRVGLWLEANTNDLYVRSWWPNRAAIPFIDIVKLGAGLNVYLPN